MSKKRNKKAKIDKNVPDIGKLADELRKVLNGLNHILDTVIVCSYAAEAKSEGELHEEMQSVLRRHVSNPMFGELLTLNKLIVSIGGESNEKFEGDDDDE